MCLFSLDLLIFLVSVLFHSYICIMQMLLFNICVFSGKGWENHIEGQKLKADGDSFRIKLNTQEIFDDWARKVQQRNLGVTGRIFAIDSQRSRTGRGNVLKLKVNFLPEIITLSKEVYALLFWKFNFIV